MSTVLVTGGSGFVGSHIILQLLAAGHVVRTTVRSLQREAGVRAMLESAGADTADRLSFFAADLERDDGWDEAVAGCDYVMHVASPMPPAAPKNEDEVIGPARDGALRVLRAARDAEVTARRPHVDVRRHLLRLPAADRRRSTKRAGPTSTAR